ncbi:ROK family transcriptional regulator [Streptococcus merionis]|uniref:ROK family transcriptional regulator n=1 Tax=Streptococcus merionis TaxID=400065 RepID=UPI0026EAD49F|nr:ROK family transcriptional regulator [Streptococcus merionis]
MLSKKQTEQRNEILECLYLHGALSRAELSRMLGITPATMTEITGYLINDGLIKECGEELNDSGVGRKKILLEVSSRYSYYMGVELSEHKLIICLTDNLGECLQSETVVKEFDQDFRLSEDNIKRSVEEFLVNHADYQIKAIGIAVPGHYDSKKQRIVSNNLFWAEFQISQIISSFTLPIYIKNNVKCMALAELYLNGEKRQRNFLFLSLKRGIFAAYVYNGQIYGDTNYLVGEVGHVVVNPDGEQCECGKAGCLQTYAGMKWLIKKARYAYEYGRSSYLNLLVDDASEISLSHLLLAYNMGDEIIHKIVEQAIDYLTLQINNLSMIVDVEAIYIHGKLFEERSIAEKLQSKLEQAPRIVQQERHIEHCVLHYNSNKGAIGACMLAIYNHFIFNHTGENQ